MIVRRVAALPSSQDLTGTPCEEEPAALKGRRGGTDEFLGRGIQSRQSPWPSGRGGRPLDKCLVQRHADAVARKSLAAVSEAVNSSPVITPRKKKCSSPVRGAPVDRRGHIRVRLGMSFSPPLRPSSGSLPPLPSITEQAQAAKADQSEGRGLGDGLAGELGYKPEIEYRARSSGGRADRED